MADLRTATANRSAITLCVSIASLMQALDTTMANVALPHIQGSVAASPYQIAWVLTSYITAAAIMTPPTGYLAGRFGIKRLFLVAVAGFTGASMLCGIAQSPPKSFCFVSCKAPSARRSSRYRSPCSSTPIPADVRRLQWPCSGWASSAGPILGR